MRGVFNLWAVHLSFRSEDKHFASWKFLWTGKFWGNDLKLWQLLIWRSGCQIFVLALENGYWHSGHNPKSMITDRHNKRWPAWLPSLQFLLMACVVDVSFTVTMWLNSTWVPWSMTFSPRSRWWEGGEGLHATTWLWPIVLWVWAIWLLLCLVGNTNWPQTVATLERIML